MYSTCYYCTLQAFGRNIKNITRANPYTPNLYSTSTTVHIYVVLIVQTFTYSVKSLKCTVLASSVVYIFFVNLKLKKKVGNQNPDSEKCRKFGSALPEYFFF
jgi:hypothetical protein